uniref:Uncharacterized protein n=1 Tax=Candidatus Methanogaster sp. ANME-2c ERB4 TaxID=2759911 RepID=A0A7G9Y1D2_9EURY|nr:hypothetical protein EABBNKNM_00031 [Methanosarcinales archaeon ANME-2c ERB4]QNO42772.1 hypothetical protein MNGOFONH_00003 [Methanosarcinales archaeon ANME-2c ERB4]
MLLTTPHNTINTFRIAETVMPYSVAEWLKAHPELADKQ